MPEKRKSSFGRKHKRQSKETKNPSWSESETSEAKGSAIDIEVSSDRMEISVVEQCESEDRVQVGQSSLRVDQGIDSQEKDVANREMDGQEAAIAFENNLEKCSKCEKQSVRAFQRVGIESEHEWPEVNESKNDSYVRKLRNNAKLDAAKHRKFRSIEDEDLRSQRQQRHAVEQKRYRNPEDKNICGQRRVTHAEEKKRYRNPGDESIHDQRRITHAE